MRLVMGIIPAIVLAGTAVGFAGPAAAEELNGTYRYDHDGPSTWSTWTVTSCGAGCADVSATGGANWAPYGGQAHLDSGLDDGEPLARRGDLRGNPARRLTHALLGRRDTGRQWLRHLGEERLWAGRAQ